MDKLQGLACRLAVVVKIRGWVGEGQFGHNLHISYNWKHYIICYNITKYNFWQIKEQREIHHYIIYEAYQTFPSPIPEELHPCTTKVLRNSLIEEIIELLESFNLYYSKYYAQCYWSAERPENQNLEYWWTKGPKWISQGFALKSWSKWFRIENRRHQIIAAIFMKWKALEN